MYKTYLYTLFAAFCLFASCSTDNDGIATPTDAHQTITATIAIADTRMTFEDKDDNGVKQLWASGDKITFYDANGNHAATFILSDGGEGNTSAEFVWESGTTLTDGQSYTAVYPATTAADVPTLAHRAQIINGSTQTGNGSLSHIDAQCYMKATYTHSGNTPVSFALEYVMLTVIIDLPVGYSINTGGAPVNLTFFNGNVTTSLNLAGIPDCHASITAYMLIEPFSAADRILRFDLLCESGYLFQKKVSSTKAYSAGKRYTASLTADNKLALVRSYTIATLPENLDDISMMVVTDAITTETDFTGIKAKLRATTSKIDLVLPNATGIGANAFQECGSLLSVSLPAAVTINTSAFALCQSITSISIPAVTTIEESAFNDCRNLTHISLPAAISVESSAFKYCIALRDINLPAVTSVKGSAFNNCIALRDINLPAVTSIGGSAFNNCGALEDINLPAATTIGGSAFSDCKKLINISLPEATSIGARAFYNCINLSTLKIATTSTGLSSIGDDIFSGVTTSNVSLTVGQGEKNNVSGRNIWRGYTFRRVSVE